MDDENVSAGETREIFCAGCGKGTRDIPLTWISSHENGETCYFCESCVRENIRAIEGRLDPSSW